MMPWFLWKGENSFAKGLLINKLPKIGHGKERYQEIMIPGRAGSLIMLEGDDVYDGYLKECIVITRNDNALRQEIINWLRGAGELIFCNEVDKIYDARIMAEVMFERISNDLSQAKIPFLVEPFKRSRYPEQEQVTLSANGTIYNPGNVASKPKVTITGSGNVTVAIAGQSMTFTAINGTSSTGTIVVDCDAQIITKGNDIWDGTFTGEFWKIPVGQSSVTTSVNTVIDPAWRWV